jgi:hypothetical protein
MDGGLRQGIDSHNTEALKASGYWLPTRNLDIVLCYIQETYYYDEGIAFSFLRWRKT